LAACGPTWGRLGAMDHKISVNTSPNLFSTGDHTLIG
jgi:hypothetical protein